MTAKKLSEDKLHSWYTRFMDSAAQEITPDIQSQIPVVPKKKFSTNSLIVVLLLLVLALLLAIGFLAYQNFQLRKQLTATIPIASIFPTPSSTPDVTVNWKTFTFDKILFKYPTDWKDPEYIQTSSVQSAEIKNNDNTQRIMVLSGINKGYTKEDLSKYINSLIESGAKKLTLDNSEAAESRVTYQGFKITTVYVTSQDKTFQYSITLQVPEAYPDQEIDKLLNQIFSTFKFSNQ